MPRDEVQDELEDAIADLDVEDAEAFVAMIDESPDLLRDVLIEYGYKPETTDDDGFLVNEDEAALSDAQRALLEELHGQLQDPKTVDEIVDLVGSEDAAFRQQYSSAQYRSWVSDQLKSLAEAGELGRFREGRNVCYVELPELAVRHWARVNGQFVEDLTVIDASEISDDMGVPARIVREAIRSIKNK